MFLLWGGHAMSCAVGLCRRSMLWGLCHGSCCELCAVAVLCHGLCFGFVLWGLCYA